MTSTEGDQRSLWWSWREAEKRSEGGQAACEPAAGLCSGDGGCHQDVMEGPASESRATFATHMYVGATDAQVCCCTLHDVERKTPTALRTDSKRRQKPLCVLEKVEQRCFGTAPSPAHLKPCPPQSVPPACAPTATTGLVSALGQEGWPGCLDVAMNVLDWPSRLPGMQCNPGDYILVTGAPTQTWQFHWLTLSVGQGLSPGDPCHVKHFHFSPCTTDRH